MDSNIFLAVVIVAACIAAFFYFQRQAKRNAEHRDASATNTASVVTGAVAKAQTDLQRAITNASIALARKPAPEVAGARQVDPPLSPAVAAPIATATPAPPPAPASPATDVAGSPLKAAEPAQTAPTASAPAAAVAMNPASPPATQAPAVPAEDGLTTFLRKLGVADSLFGPIHAFAYTQPGTVTFTEIVKAFAAGPKPMTASDYDWAVVNRAAQLLQWEQNGAWVPQTPTLTYDGKDYDTKAIYERFMLLTDPQRSVVLQSDVVVGNAVEAWLGRTNETKAFLTRYLDGDLRVLGGGSYDNAAGRIGYIVNGEPHIDTVAPLY